VTDPGVFNAGAPLYRIAIVTDSAAPLHETPTAPPSLGDVLSIDLMCVHCGYNLRGLSPSGLCPECGHAIADSTRGDRLCFADPKWLARVRHGTSLKLSQVAIWFLGGVLAAVATAVLSKQGAIVVVLVGFLAELCALLGSFSITTQEPRISLQEDPVTLRRAVRVMASAAFLGAVLELPGQYVGGFSASLVAVVSVVLRFLGLGAIAGEWVYLRRLARRLPDTKLVRSATAVLWAVPICTVAVVVMVLLALWVSPARGAPGPSPLPAVACVIPVVLLIVLLAYVRVLSRFRKALGKAIAEASGCAS